MVANVLVAAKLKSFVHASVPRLGDAYLQIIAQFYFQSVKWALNFTGFFYKVFQFIEATRALARCGILCSHNGIVAIDYLQQCTCNGNLHYIEKIIALSCMSYLRLMVKTI